jgi:hypothetical protein
MAAWELYAGMLEVDSNDYVERAITEEGDDVEGPVEGLDEVVVEMPHVDLTLDYPFENPYSTVVDGGPDGVTLRQIIDAVRRGFREMYRETSQSVTSLPGNPRVEGKYGVAFHPIGDLVIEGIVFHEDDGRLEILIGS